VIRGKVVCQGVSKQKSHVPKISDKANETEL